MSVDDFQASSHRQYMLSLGNSRLSNDSVLVSGSSVVALRVNSTGCTPRLHGVHCSFEPSSFSFVAHLILHRHLWSQASDAYRAIRTSFRQRKLITHVNEEISITVEQRYVNVLSFPSYFLVDRWQRFESLFSTQRTRTTHWSTGDRRTSLRSTGSSCLRSTLLHRSLSVCVLRQLIFSSVIMSKSGTRHRSVRMNHSFKMWRTASTSPFDIWQKGDCLLHEQPARCSLSFPSDYARSIGWNSVQAPWSIVSPHMCNCIAKPKNACDWNIPLTFERVSSMSKLNMNKAFVEMMSAWTKTKRKVVTSFRRERERERCSFLDLFCAIEFLRDIVEVLIYILLPANEFRCVPARMIIRVRSFTLVVSRTHSSRLGSGGQSRSRSFHRYVHRSWCN